MLASLGSDVECIVARIDTHSGSAVSTCYDNYCIEGSVYEPTSQGCIGESVNDTLEHICKINVGIIVC